MSTPEQITSEVLFELGSIYITPGAIEALVEAGENAQIFLRRHVQGDWGGELDEHDQKENEFSVREGLRILSAYRTSKGVRLWIITEADRSSTTILLPAEY